MQAPLSANLGENESLLRDVYADCADVVFRRFATGDGTNALVLYVDGLTNIEELDRCVLAPLMLQTADLPARPPSGQPQAAQPFAQPAGQPAQSQGPPQAAEPPEQPPGQPEGPTAPQAAQPSAQPPGQPAQSQGQPRAAEPPAQPSGPQPTAPPPGQSPAQPEQSPGPPPTRQPTTQQPPAQQPSVQPPDSPDPLANLRIPVSGAKPVADIAGAVREISIGGAVLLIDGRPGGVAFVLSNWEKRSPDEPKAEPVIRGSREGFTETIADNTAQLRRKIRSPQLKMREFEIGRLSRTRVIVAYIEGLADAALIEDVTARLGRIDIDGILESGYIEELIEDNPWSPFPQVLSTERPDAAAASLLEGRVVLLVDGTPFALVVPTSLFSLLQSAEDYYQRFWISTSIRWLRYLFFLLSLLLPSVYVAVLTYHQEMLPTTLLLSMARSREEVPFPALVEALLMEITFEALREAGVRLPKQVGTAVSIVGALVIGEAAVSAGLVSAPMVMVVSLTGIASFTIPRYSAGFAFRMLRFPIILLAGTLGLLGIMLGVLAIIVHMCRLRSFGVPYLYPLSPMNGNAMRDIFIRAPWWMLGARPLPGEPINPRRQSGGQRPGPEPGDGQG